MLERRKPFIGRDRLPADIKGAYDQAVDVFNARVWTGSTTLCGRTLEAIVEDLGRRHKLNTDKKQRAPKRIREILAAHLDADDSLTRLADSIRLGRNIGAHFDPDHTPDECVATRMLDLVEYLLEYVYSLPAMIDGAREALDSLEQADSTAESDGDSGAG
ncbi:MAG: DUF4145 domain-containing protein [Phycisphaerales bacterium]